MLVCVGSSSPGNGARRNKAEEKCSNWFHARVFFEREGDSAGTRLFPRAQSS